MNRATLYRQHCLAQTLAKCWVWMNSLDDLIGSKFASHSYRVLTDQVRSIWPDNMRTQDFVVLANNDLRKPIRFGYRDSLSVSNPWKALDTGFRIFLFGLRFG